MAKKAQSEATGERSCCADSVKTVWPSIVGANNALTAHAKKEP
jgi:hypothetical protein